MEPNLSSAYTALADALCYPAPRRLELLRSGQAALPEGAGKETYAAFLASISRLSLGEWEELHTRTLDLNPPAAPYIGYQVWGESYQRGAFLAQMNGALAAAGIPGDGELPDHLIPVLRYLASASQPLPQMVEVLGPAVDRMLSALRTAEPKNPYVDLLRAVQALCQGLKKEAA